MAADLYKPFVWMQTISASVAKIHFTVRLDGHEILENLTSDDIVPDAEGGKLTLNYNVTGGHDTAPDAAYDAEGIYEIEDTAYEDVTINVEQTAKRKKGTGTVQQSEGDTSGDD